MTVPLSNEHQKRFEAIKKSLHLLGHKESEFVKVELLFYEALTISRAYGDDQNANSLLAALKNVQHNQYEKTKTLTKKAGQRELLIKKFVVTLKRVLAGTQ